MLELGLSGSVRGVPSNAHPYRDPRPTAAVGVTRFTPFQSLPSPDGCSLIGRKRKFDPLFVDLVSLGRDQSRHGEAERFGDLHVDDKLECRGLLYRQFGGACTLENLIDISRCLSVKTTLFRRRSCEKVAPAGSLKRTAAFL
jgi:hypothetical protein